MIGVHTVGSYKPEPSQVLTLPHTIPINFYRWLYSCSSVVFVFTTAYPNEYLPLLVTLDTLVLDNSCGDAFIPWEVF